jgi:hypothetical protein
MLFNKFYFIRGFFLFIITFYERQCGGEWSCVLTITCTVGCLVVWFNFDCQPVK